MRTKLIGDGRMAGRDDARSDVRRGPGCATSWLLDLVGGGGRDVASGWLLKI